MYSYSVNLMRHGERVGSGVACDQTAWLPKATGPYKLKATVLDLGRLAFQVVAMREFFQLGASPCVKHGAESF